MPKKKRTQLKTRFVSRTRDNIHPVKFPAEPTGHGLMPQQDPEDEPEQQPFKIPLLNEQEDDQECFHIYDITEPQDQDGCLDPEDDSGTYLDMSDWEEDFD